jgi:hypothetical protein
VPVAMRFAIVSLFVLIVFSGRSIIGVLVSLHAEGFTGHAIR